LVVTENSPAAIEVPQAKLKITIAKSGITSFSNRNSGLDYKNNPRHTLAIPAIKIPKHAPMKFTESLTTCNKSSRPIIPRSNETLFDINQPEQIIYFLESV